MSCSWCPVSGGQDEDLSPKLVVKRNKCNCVHHQGGRRQLFVSRLRKIQRMNGQPVQEY